VNAEAQADLLRVTASSSPDRLVYCSSQKLSEDKVDEITKLIKRHVPSGSALVLGGIQLGALAEKYADIFEKHCHAEVQAIRSTILTAPSGDGTTTRGLRLALIAFGSDEAAALRHEILRTSVLEFFGDGKTHTIRQITEIFSMDLGLPRPLRGFSRRARPSVKGSYCNVTSARLSPERRIYSSRLLGSRRSAAHEEMASQVAGASGLSGSKTKAFRKVQNLRFRHCRIMTLRRCYQRALPNAARIVKCKRIGRV
jgi:hypothetical protein